MKNSKPFQMIINLVAIFVLIMVDQYTKYLAVINLKNNPAYELIDGVLELRYLENRGAAFGMLQDKIALFVFSTSIMLLIVFYVLIKLPMKKKFGMWQIALCSICAGGIGNMIDRIRYDYVIDYIYFKIIDFPIFNFADICITVGTILLFLVILFFTKEEELSFLKFNIRKD